MWIAELQLATLGGSGLRKRQTGTSCVQSAICNYSRVVMRQTHLVPVLPNKRGFLPIFIRSLWNRHTALFCCVVYPRPTLQWLPTQAVLFQFWKFGGCELNECLPVVKLKILACRTVKVLKGGPVLVFNENALHQAIGFTLHPLKLDLSWCFDSLF